MRLIDSILLKKKIAAEISKLDIPQEFKKEIEATVLKTIENSDIFTIEKIIIPQFQKESGIWYRVDRKLPPKNCSVLCYFIYGDGSGAMSENYHFGNNRWISDGDHVAYWRTLPDLPNEIIEKIGQDDFE